MCGRPLATGVTVENFIHAFLSWARPKSWVSVMEAHDISVLELDHGKAMTEAAERNTANIITEGVGKGQFFIYLNGEARRRSHGDKEKRLVTDGRPTQ